MSRKDLLVLRHLLVLRVVKTYKIDSSSQSEIVQEAAAVIRDGGVVCLPCAGRYRLFADLLNNDAVMRLMQAKSRIKTAPALVFVEGASDIDQVAEEIPALARKIADELWPQPVTIRVKPSSELPKKVLKQLGGKKVRLGLRTPGSGLAQEVLKAVGSPLLVSSANREKKAGESSSAQVTKTFGPHIDLFINDGDLSPEAASTIIKFENDAVIIERLGAVDEATIESCTQG
jgi:L-threonylcarbamoyladenylate synthase